MENDVLGYDSYQRQLDEARKKLTQMANPNMAQPQQTQPQATQNVTQPVETGTVYIPGVGMVDKATSKVIQPENKPATPQQPQNMINPLQQQLAEQKRKASISALDYAKQQALGGINAQRQELPKQTLANVGQARASADISARNLKEYMAQRFGSSISGAEGQGLMNIQTQRQGAESQANLNEQMALAELGRREADIGSKYASDVANVEADIQSQALQDELARQQQLELQARQDAIRQEGYTREDLLNQQELARKETDRVRQAELDTIGRYSNDYTAEIQRRQATPDTSDDALIPYLETAKAEKVTNINQNKAQTEQAQAKAQAEFEKAQYDRAMKIWEQTGVADANVSAIIGVPVGTKTSDKSYKDAQIALDKIKASKTSSGSSDKLTLNQALTNARLILGNDATAQEVQTLAAQLQGGTGIKLTTSTDKPKVTPPSKKTPTPAKDTLDWLYKLRRESDLVSIGNFMNDPGNIKELNSIISNPTSTDDEITYAEQILKDYKQYSTGNYITGR